MKRFLAVLLAAVLILSAAGCGGSDSGSGQVSKAETSKAGQTSGAESSKAAESEAEESKAAEPTGEVFAVVNGPDNSYYNNYFASDGKDVYYLNNFKLWKVNMSGDDGKVFGAEDALTQRSDLTGGDGRLFYFGMAKNHDLDGLYSYDTATGTETFLGVTGCSKLFYHGGMVYYSTVDGIGCCKADGTDAKTLVESKIQYWQLYTDWIYYVTGDAHLWRIKTDGSANEDTGNHSSHHIVVYQGKFPENSKDLILNTDGEYLYAGTFKGVYKCTSAGDPESGTLIFAHESSDTYPDIKRLHVAGGFVIFQTGDDHWHVVSKDGGQEKELAF